MSAVFPVSIVIRSMDRPSLGRALDSISAQSLKPAEVLVVAASGTSHRPLPSMDPAIRRTLVHPQNGVDRLSRPLAANAGLMAASQEWIAFLDDDDEYMPEHLASVAPVAQQAFLADRTRGRLAYSLAQGVDAFGNKTDVYGRSFSFVHIWDNTILHTMNAVFHRSLVQEGCLFDESLDIHEDWDFWIQCSQKTAFTFVEQVTTLWHGAEGESGCGFGANVDDSKYRAVQARVRSKWSAVRASTLERIGRMNRDALEAISRGDEALATRLSQLVLHLDPENAEMANLLGSIVLRRGDLKSAEQLIETALRNSAPHFGLCLNMGLVRMAQGDRDAAREWFDKGLALNPGHPGLLKRRSELQDSA